MRFWPTRRKAPEQYGVPFEQIQAPPRPRVWRERVLGDDLWIVRVSIDGELWLKGFHTHAAAIAHADKVARR